MAIIFRKQPSFRRALRFLIPHRRLLIIGVLCSFGVALAYSASIGAILPVLKLMVSDEGLTGYVRRHAAMERLGGEIRAVDADGAPAGSRFVVTDVPEDAPMAIAGVGRGDILSLPPDADAPGDLLRAIIGAPRDRPMRLSLHRPDVDEPIVVAVKLEPVPAGWRVGVALVNRLPFDDSNFGRLAALACALGFVLAINIVGNVCRFFAEFLVLVAASRAMMDFRRRMYGKVLTLPITWFSRNLSDTMSRFVQDSQDVFRGYVLLFGKLLREPLKAVAVLVLALYLDYRLTLAVVIGAPVGGLILYRFGKTVRKAQTRLLMGYGRMIGGLTATLGGMRVVRAYTREGYERRRIWRIEREMLKQVIKMGRIEALTSPLIETIGVTLAMVGIVWLAYRTLIGTASPASFIQMVILMVALFDPVRKIASLYNRIQRADASAERIFGLLDMPVEQVTSRSRRQLPPPARAVEFERVTFTYPEATTPAVRDFSLVVPVGQQLAVVGPNGSGKTTLISLLLRFFDPQSGRITIDGTDIRDVSIKSLREKFSLITQDAVVFAMSIADNIGYGRSGATREEIVAAARRAHADEFIQRMPQGYETIAGEFGVNLSGGQRQRIALARAILRDAPIFVFDEATSQIDVESEQRIREAMREFMVGRTSFIIAHRIATVQHAGQIVVMNEGRIADVGPHEQLMSRCELYRTLYSTHLAGEGERSTADDESDRPGDSADAA